MVMPMTQYDFVRSHGLGNDYLVVDPARLGFKMTARRAQLLCDRHEGVGSDGVLEVLKPSVMADFALRIWNPDGSEAEKSGNGLRIFSKFLYDHGYTRRREFTVQTLGGLVAVRLFGEVGNIRAARVEMGQAVINRKLTTLVIPGDGTLSHGSGRKSAAPEKLPVVVLSVGNPHCVCLVYNLAKVDFFRLGPLIENHRAFPKRTNVQFAQVRSRSRVKALIWERGAGHTKASGSSSCAVAAACYDQGLVGRRVTVEMEGGNLEIEIGDGLALTMTGFLSLSTICST